MKKGFTLFEVLVSLLIILIGIIIISQFLPSFITSSIFLNLEFTASYLAQEGIELVRNIRDSNLINDRPWNKGIEKGSWLIDFQKNKLFPYKDEFLKINEEGFYGYSGKDTPFKRKIIISEKEGGILITSKVSYLFKGKEYEISVQEILYDWIR